MSPQYEPMDPANQSLADALKLSLRILKGIMICMVLLFLGSGIFMVEKDEVALVLRLGKVTGTKADQVLKPGLHWSMPFPISEVIRIPIASKNLLIKDFWYYEPPEGQSLHSTKIPPLLNPELDGYCLTGDNNIVHFIWQIEYKIEDPYLYIRNQKSPELLLRNVLGHYIVRTIASFSVNDVLLKRTDELRKIVQEKAQRELNQLESGLQIVKLETPAYIPARQVQQAFESVTQATTERNQKITAAQSYKTQILNKAKGEYAKLITNAKNQSLATEKSAESDASYFEQLVEEYQLYPQIFAQRHHQRMIERISGKIREIFVLTSSAKERDIQIRLNRNPELNKIKLSQEENK